MILRYFVLAAIVGACGAGCNKKTPPAPAPARAETIARIHWLGKKRLTAETNAAYFISLLNLPESAKLEAQTLDKLSLAPWRAMTGDTLGTNAASSLLRPLLDDLLQEESYLEIRHVTNRPVGEAAFAIRLGAERGAAWETNLALVLESSTGLRAAAPAQSKYRGWSLKKHDAPNLIEFTRVADWGVIGLAQDRNELLADLVARIGRDGRPRHDTNAWLDLSVDFPRLRRALPARWSSFPELPKVTLNVTADGQNVITRGQFTLNSSLSLEMEPWNIPTNLVQEPLLSFTAIRGIKPWLSSHVIWTSLQMGAPPNQVYFWTLQPSPLQAYFAMPAADASNRVFKLAGDLIEKYNPRVASNGWGRIERTRDFTGVIWNGVPFVVPYIRSDTFPEGEFLSGGLFPFTSTNPPPPDELLQHLRQAPNLVGYDWEVTGPRVEAFLYLTQVARLLSNKAQLPPDSLSMLWLKALIPKLGNSVTEVSQTGPGQFSLVRNSSSGFTSAELHLLADWLESPRFPVGCHTLLAPPETPAITNTPPQQR